MKKIIDIEFTYEAEVKLPRKRNIDIVNIQATLPYEINIKNIEHAKKFMRLERKERENNKIENYIDIEGDIYKEAQYSLDEILEHITTLDNVSSGFFGLNKKFFQKAEDMPEYKDYIQDNRRYIESEIKHNLDNFFNNNIIYDNKVWKKSNKDYTVSATYSSSSFRDYFHIEPLKTFIHDTNEISFPIQFLDAAKAFFDNPPQKGKFNFDGKYIMSFHIGNLHFLGKAEEYEDVILKSIRSNYKNIINSIPAPNGSWMFERMSASLILLYAQEVIPLRKWIGEWEESDYTKENIEDVINIYKKFHDAYVEEEKNNPALGTYDMTKIMDAIQTFHHYNQAIEIGFQKAFEEDAINFLDCENDNFISKKEYDTNLKLMK